MFGDGKEDRVYGLGRDWVLIEQGPQRKPAPQLFFSVAERLANRI